MSVTPDYGLGDISFGGDDGSASAIADPSAYSFGNTQSDNGNGSNFSWSNVGNFAAGLIDKGVGAYSTIKTANASTSRGAIASGRPEAYAYNGYRNQDLFTPGSGGGISPLLIIGAIGLVAVLFIAEHK